MEEEGSEEKSGVSLGNDGTSSRESMFDGRKSSLGTTVTIEESMVSGDTSVSDPIGNTGLGCGDKSSQNWKGHILTYPEEVLRDRSPLTVLTW